MPTTPWVLNLLGDTSWSFPNLSSHILMHTISISKQFNWLFKHTNSYMDICKTLNNYWFDFTTLKILLLRPMHVQRLQTYLSGTSVWILDISSDTAWPKICVITKDQLKGNEVQESRRIRIAAATRKAQTVIFRQVVIQETVEEKNIPPSKQFSLSSFAEATYRHPFCNLRWTGGHRRPARHSRTLSRR